MDVADLVVKLDGYLHASRKMPNRQLVNAVLDFSEWLAEVPKAGAVTTLRRDDVFLASFLVLEFFSGWTPKEPNLRYLRADMCAFAVAYQNPIIDASFALEHLPETFLTDKTWTQESDDGGTYESRFVSSVISLLEECGGLFDTALFSRLRFPLLRDIRKIVPLLRKVKREGKAKFQEKATVHLHWRDFASRLLFHEGIRSITLASHLRFSRRHAFTHLHRGQPQRHVLFDWHGNLRIITNVLALLKNVEKGDFRPGGALLQSLYYYHPPLRDNWFAAVASEAIGQPKRLKALGKGLIRFDEPMKKSRGDYVLVDTELDSFRCWYESEGVQLAKAIRKLRSLVKMGVIGNLAACKSPNELTANAKSKIAPDHLRMLEQIWRFRKVAVHSRVAPYMFASAYWCMVHGKKFEEFRMLSDDEKNRRFRTSTNQLLGDTVAEFVSQRGWHAYRQRYDR